MIDATSDSHSSTNPASWICQGTTASPHPEIENWGDSCMFPSCKNTKEDLSKTSVSRSLNNGQKLVFFWGMALALIACLGGGTYLTFSLWQKFKPCPEGQSKQNEVCLVIVEESTSSPKTPINPTSIAFNSDLVSNSDRVLFKGSSNKASAQEILRGVGDAQTKFNDAGVGGRLVQIIIANFFGNKRCKQSGSSR